MKQAIKNDLNFFINTPSGRCSFLQLVMDERFDKKNHYIPKLRPPLKKQLDRPTCGFIAFWSGIKSSNPSQLIPFSLFSYGKKIGITEMGHLYNVEHFNKIAQKLKFKGGKAVLFSDDEDQYIKEICDIVETGSKIIIACDIEKHGFPSNQKGEYAHWALIDGYFFYNKKCFFLVTHVGSGWAWSANALFESNKNLPLLNPAYGKYHELIIPVRYIPRRYISGRYHVGNVYYYYKITKTYLSYALSLLRNSKKSIEEKDLSKFRFYGYCIPAKTKIEIHNDIDASIAETERNIFKSGVLLSIDFKIHYLTFEFISEVQRTRIKNFYFTKDKEVQIDRKKPTLHIPCVANYDEMSKQVILTFNSARITEKIYNLFTSMGHKEGKNIQISHHDFDKQKKHDLQIPLYLSEEGYKVCFGGNLSRSTLFKIKNEKNPTKRVSKCPQTCLIL